MVACGDEVVVVAAHNVAVVDATVVVDDVVATDGVVIAVGAVAVVDVYV